MTATRPCPTCGTALSLDSRFCGACGTQMAPIAAAPAPAPVVAPAPVAPSPGPQRTMLGVQAVNLAAVQASVAAGMRAGMQPGPQQPAPTPAPAPAQATHATMLGMPAVQLPQAATPPQIVHPAAQSAPVPHAAAAAPAVAKNATMLGMPAVQYASGQPAQPAPVPQPAVPREKMANATMLGMPAIALPKPGAPAQQSDAVSPQQAAHPPVAAAPPAAAPVAAASRPSIAAQTNRTMLGVSIPLSEILPPELAQQHGGSAQPVAPGSAWDTTVSSSGLSSPGFSQDSLDIPGQRRTGRGLLFAVIAVVALLVLAASGVGLYFALRGGGGPEVRVAVTRERSSDALEVTVPGAVAGTKLRYGATERPLEGGRATFPLAADALRVGDNVITVVVLAPGEEPVSRNITLQFSYRVRADLAGLGAAQPTLAVVVDAKPGSVVMLDGTPLALDPAGHATRTYPLDVAAARDGKITHVANYTITPPGAAVAQGAVTTEVPVTRASIDRPGLTLVTQRDSVEIAGRVEPGATVTIEGAPVPVRDGKFVHRLALPTVGTQTPRVVASAPGKASLPLALTVRRVASLAEEARGFVPERGVSYARLRPAVASFVGKRVAFEGRVGLVEVSGDKSSLQILVRDCPRGEGCPLWVSNSGGTDVAEGSLVRVLGTVSGERRYTSQTGEQLVAPGVDAAFVVPLDR
jgi:hypothetical protein